MLLKCWRANLILSALRQVVAGMEVLSRSHQLSLLSPTNYVDSEIIVHDISQRRKILRIPQAHKGKVSGLCWTEDERLLSCGVDCNVKLWDTRSTTNDDDIEMDNEAGPSGVSLIRRKKLCCVLTISQSQKPLGVFAAKNAFKYVLSNLM